MKSMMKIPSQAGVMMVLLLVTVFIVRGFTQDSAADATPVSVSVVLVSSMKGSELKKGDAGIAFVRVTGPSGYDLPLFCLTGKGRQSATPAFSSLDFYSGFEVADILCEFIDEKSQIATREKVVATCRSLEFRGAGVAEIVMPVLAPPNPGRYTLRVTLDNRNVKDGCLSVNFPDVNLLKQSIFVRLSGEARSITVLP